MNTCPECQKESKVSLCVDWRIKHAIIHSPMCFQCYKRIRDAHKKKPVKANFQDRKP
jgi:transcription elongation factor Elf1